MNLKIWRSMSREERRQAVAQMSAAEKKDLSRRIMRAHNKKSLNSAMQSLGLKKVIGAVSGKTYWE